MNDDWIDTQAGYVWPVWCGRDYIFKVSERGREGERDGGSEGGMEGEEKLEKE